MVVMVWMGRPWSRRRLENESKVFEDSLILRMRFDMFSDLSSWQL